MKKFIAFSASLALALGVGLSCAAISGTSPSVEASAATIGATKAYAIVQGYEWGPAVPKVVLEFADDVIGVENDTFAVSFSNRARTVTAAYNSDENGVESEDYTHYVAIEMTVQYNVNSPFSYNMSTGRNTWVANIAFTVTVNAGKSFTAGDLTYEGGDTFTYSAGAADRKVPQTASWTKDTVHYTGEGKDITLQRASWAPEGAESDSGKNPLVIWLHGAGEGGTDIDIDLLGNEVTALTTENETNLQHYFAQYGLKGAYVLAVQTPTMWMDSGNGSYNNGSGTGKQESYYTEALWQAITTYVESNSDVDTNRIYLGGCSNGGYMTMNMAFEHGDYFAAFYPICEAYDNSRISDEMIEGIKDYNIWFLQSSDDGTVAPNSSTVPTFFRLLQAGAENVHFTFTEHVTAVDDPTATNGGIQGTYMGHWSWIMAFNDVLSKEFDNDTITAQSDITFANCTKDGNLWAWLAEQTLDGSKVADHFQSTPEPAPTPTPADNGGGLPAYAIALIVVGGVLVVGGVVAGVIVARKKKN